MCVFLVHMFTRCVCVCCRGFAVLCRRVFPECGGSERHVGYALMEHTGAFFMHLQKCTHSTPPCAPVHRHCRSALRIETNQLIHWSARLNVIKIYRSWFLSPVTDWHSLKKFGSGLKRSMRGNVEVGQQQHILQKLRRKVAWLWQKSMLPVVCGVLE